MGCKQPGSLELLRGPGPARPRWLAGGQPTRTTLLLAAILFGLVSLEPSAATAVGGGPGSKAHPGASAGPTSRGASRAGRPGTTRRAVPGRLFPERSAPGLYRVPIAGAPTRGPADALLTLVTFTDFNCSACGKMALVLDKLQRSGRSVRQAFRFFPLWRNKAARRGMVAALAAARQGRFWPFHDRLFALARKGNLGKADLREIARSAGLDLSKFDRDRRDPRLLRLVARDLASGRRLGLRMTPVTFVNGARVSGVPKQKAWLRLLAVQERRARDALARGISRRDLYRRLVARGRSGSDGFLLETWRSARPVWPRARYHVRQAGAPALGSSRPLVQVVLFGDLQCRRTATMARVLDRLLGRYRGELRLTFRHLPLRGRPLSRLAARATVAAFYQKRFWPFYASLLSMRVPPTRARTLALARRLGLKMAKFTRDLEAGYTRRMVKRDLRLARRLRVYGTPTIFVNGRKQVGARPLEWVHWMIEQELVLARKTLASGVPYRVLYRSIAAWRGRPRFKVPRPTWR